MSCFPWEQRQVSLVRLSRIRCSLFGAFLLFCFGDFCCCCRAFSECFLCRTRLQAQGVDGAPRQYSSAIDCMRQVVSKEVSNQSSFFGRRGFFVYLLCLLSRVLEGCSVESLPTFSKLYLPFPSLTWSTKRRCSCCE